MAIPDWVMAQQSAQELWNHLERHHNIVGLSIASVRNNKKVWLMTHARIHGHRTGYLGVEHELLQNHF